MAGLLLILLACLLIFVYIKHVVSTIGLNTWGLVLYNNLEALILFPIEVFIVGEIKKMRNDSLSHTVPNWYTFEVILLVGLLCIFGLSISFFGFSCRKAIWATGFTVLGIVNKLLTIMVNLLVWDKHSRVVGTVGLLVCVFGGVLYQQSTTKPKAVSEVDSGGDIDDEEQQALIEMKIVGENNNVTSEGKKW